MYRRVRDDMLELYKTTSGIHIPQLCTFVKMRVYEIECQGARRHQKTIDLPNTQQLKPQKKFILQQERHPMKLAPHQCGESVNNQCLDRHWSNQPSVWEYWDHTAHINARMAH